MASNDANAGAAGGGTIYFICVLGAGVWFWREAEGFWEHALALLQALVWPGILVYEGFEALAG